MHAFLRFFDQAPVRCLIIAWLSLGLVLALAVAPRLAPRAWFAAALAFALLAFRWPDTCAGRLYNPDEDQLFAAALTYAHDGVPWRSVDLHTAGPLDGYVLVPASRLNARYAYVGARLTALFLQGVTLLGCYALLSRRGDERGARFAILPGLAFLAFTNYWDMIQYASEDLAVALLVTGAWFVSSDRSWPRVWAAGVVFGCVPWAKLQAVPLIPFFCLLGWNSGNARPSWRAFAAGLVFPAALVTALLTIYGLWREFWDSYVIANVGYAGAGPGRQEHIAFDFLHRFVDIIPGFGLFFWGCIGIGLLGCAGAISSSARYRTSIGLAALATLVSWVCVTMPGREFEHYLRLMVAPLALFAGYGILSLFQWRAGNLWGAAVAVALGLAPQVASRAERWQPALGHTAESFAPARDPLADRIAALAHSGDALTVWGWRPDFHLRTGLPQGTRDAHFEREVVPSGLWRFYRSRYLQDLRKHRPRFFIDAVGPENFLYTSAATYGIRSWPELNAYVLTYYQRDLSAGSGTIYLRR